MSGDQTATQEHHLQHHIDSDISAAAGNSSLIFPKSLVTVSSTEQVILPKQFENVASLENGNSVSGFTMDDIVGTSVSESTSVACMSHLGDGTDNLSGLTLVGNSGGEFMIVSSGADLDSTDVILQNGPTITLSLDDATRYLLQQRHGITQAVELPDGTFQILKQPVLKVEKGDGVLEAQTLHIEVLQALQGGLAQQMPGIDSSYSMGEDLVNLSDMSSSSSIIKTEVIPTIHLEEPEIDAADQKVVPDIADSPVAEAGNKEQVEIDSVNRDEHSTKKRLQSKEDKKGAGRKVLEKKQPDLNSPIPLSNQTVVTVQGKKCVLAFNQETQLVCAYPIKPPPGSKRRGRPRMTEEEKAAAAERKRLQQLSELAGGCTTVQVSPSEKSSAAETLLELSNIGSDGIRRSARKRKKAKLFEEFEELEDSGEEEDLGFDDNQEKDPDISLSLPEAKKKKKIAPAKKETGASASTAFITSAQPVKRGRGRPRRYPPSGHSQTTSVPAIVIPSSSGQTLVMTDIQGLQNLQSFQRHLPNLVPKPLIDQNSMSMSITACAASDSAECSTLSLGSDTDTLPLDTSTVLDSNNIIPPALQGDTIPLVGDNVDSSDQGDTLDQTSPGLLSFMAATASATDKLKDAPSADTSIQPTVIQIPDNILASLGFKKDPIKIGLKASERELEKLKCSKCDFQGYYVQQYRNHIATHGEDIQKCKCCSYLSLDSEELLEHFKEYHPRCICTECDYMAEHAYIIKRHMMRHDTKSCTCNLCGKVYKDMYILKMHVKMVHMPAEVLFECNVCSKKFTRKAHLKRHLRIHEPEKPYKCPVCDYRGCERSDISKHMLIHEEPKHTCERCGKSFRHVKNKELHVKRHYGQRDYKCGVCDFFGYTFTDIRKHIERKHQDIKTLICDKCNKHFRNELALKEHQQTCNVMMIEQVLAIPTSGGGTSQATIQIPANLGPDTRLILDGQSITVEGQAISVNKHGGVSIMVSGEPQLGLTEGATEDEEEDLEDEEGDENQTMHIINDSIMSGPGEQIQVLSQDSLSNSRHNVLTQQGKHTSQVLTEEGQVDSLSLDAHIMAEAGQLLDQIDQNVMRTKQISAMASAGQELSQNFVHQQEASCNDLATSELCPPTRSNDLATSELCPPTRSFL